MRYIEAESVKDSIRFEMMNITREQKKGCLFALQCIDQQPTADVRENVHGYWLDALDTAGGEYYRCSECGTYIEKTFFANDYTVNFCPNCGADMREGRDDNKDDCKRCI